MHSFCAYGRLKNLELKLVSVHEMKDKQQITMVVSSSSTGELLHFHIVFTKVLHDLDLT